MHDWECVIIASFLSDEMTLFSYALFMCIKLIRLHAVQHVAEVTTIYERKSPVTIIIHRCMVYMAAVTYSIDTWCINGLTTANLYMYV